MRVGGVILGPAVLILSMSAAAPAQNQQYRPPGTFVGRLQSVGRVGASSVLRRFGQVGGLNTDLRSGPSVFGRSRSRGRLSPARGQVSRFGASAGSPRSPNDFRYRPRGPLATTQSQRAAAQFYTRPDVIRSKLPPRLRQTGPMRDLLLRPTRRVATPVGYLLERRNLLRARSPLSQLARSHRASDAAESIEGPTGIESLTIGEIKPRSRSGVSVEQFLENRLETKTEEYYSLGVRYFHDGRFLEADDCFRVCKTMDRKEIRYWIADVVVAHQREELHRTFLSLRKALALYAAEMERVKAELSGESIGEAELERERSRLVDALRIPRWDGDGSLDARGFYQDRDAFEQVVDRANVRANRAKAGAGGGTWLLYSYFAWLSGERGTAIDATRAAEQDLPDEYKPVAKIFLELLIAEQG